ncbi:MAG: oligopeptide transport system permease protein [Pirellulaceae bacterium]|jgi:oligopeptide transport system permease protein
MIRLLLDRIFTMAITLWVVFTITFVLVRFTPGGPFMEEKPIPEEIRRTIEAKFHMHDPLWKQYTRHLWNTACLDFGPSYKMEDYTVNEIIAEGFPVSASLGIFAMVFAIILGVTSGVVSAVRRYSVYDYGFMSVAILGIAVPNFVLGSLAIILFVFILGWFPAAGWGTLQQIILPAICLGLPFAGYIARLTRTGMLEVLSQDYIRTAYAKGLAPAQVIVKHALRGALLPVVSYLGPATAGILSGSLVLERIFVLPGMGSHFLEGAFQRDYLLVMGMVMVYTALVFVMNSIVDFSYAIIDPRIGSR